jgi:hypothetical protein
MESLPPLFDSLAEYPRWFMAACLTVVTALVIWGLIKMLKWTLYLLLALVLLGGGGLVVWLLLNPR